MKKTILITGSSTGIGKATAIYFANQGWNVVATMRQPEKADAELRRSDIFMTRLDVTEEDSIISALTLAEQQFGKIDAILNNAGYGLFGALEALSYEQIEQQFNTNYFGVVRVLRHAIPMMRKHQGGLIMTVSSIGGRMAFPFSSLYHSTKFALEGLHEAIRYELKSHHIQVKLIEPGATQSDFMKRSLIFAKHPAYDPQQFAYQKILDQEVYWGSVDDIAKTIFRAATDGKRKLRYLAKPGIFYYLYQIFPERLWNFLLHRMLNSKKIV